MKKFLSCLLVLATLLSSTISLAAEKNLGFTLESFYTDMNTCLDTLGSLGFQHYRLELSEKDKENQLVTTPLSMHCSLMINQGDGMVESIRIVSDEQHGDSSDDHTVDIITCFLAAMLLTNSMFTEDNAMTYLNEIVSDHQEHTYGNVTYRFGSTAPFSTNVYLDIAPAA